MNWISWKIIEIINKEENAHKQLEILANAVILTGWLNNLWEGVKSLLNVPSELMRLVPAQSPGWLNAIPRTSILKQQV